MAEDKKTIDELIANDPEMVAGFVAEAKEHLDTVENDFLVLEKQKNDPDQTLLNKVFRAIHSVKGAAGFLGLANMIQLAHVMETVLSRMRAGEILPESEYIDALLAGVDLLSSIVDDIRESKAVDITDVCERLSSALPDTTPGTKDSESVSPAQAKGIESAAPDRPGPAAPETFEVDFAGTVRIDVDILDKLMVQAGELVLVRNQYMLSMDEADPVSRSISQRLDMVTSEMQETILRTRMQPIGKIFGKLPRIVRELEKRFGKEIRITISGSEAELDKTIIEALADPMIHIIRNSCSHGIETPEERRRAGKPESGHIMISAYHEAGRVNIEIRDDGRGIDSGRIRKKVLERGLKTEAEVEAMSDNEMLDFILMPGFTTVDEVSDVFGRGVGMDVVKMGLEKVGGSLDLRSTPGAGTAVHLGLPLTLAIISCLIVTAGGNRYAIPRRCVEELVCLYDEDVKNRIECADDQEVYRLRDRLLPMVRLSEILARPRRFTREVRAEITERYRKEQEKVWKDFEIARAGGIETSFVQSLNFAVVNGGANRFGLIVDKILGTEEIVVKPMHRELKKLRIYSGATIMGDGKVALIMDVEGMAGHAGITFGGLLDEVGGAKGRSAEDGESQTVLLFKSGEKEQFAMALSLIRRIEPISLSDIGLIGEREYITVDGISTRVLRLDHALSVTPVIERKEMLLILPRYVRRPVGLLISRLIDIEETAASLNVESYMEDGLLGTDIVRGAITLFIDMDRLVEIIEPEWSVDPRAIPGPKAEGAAESPKQVLLLEDDPIFRNSVLKHLEASGYKVITAENGQVGLDRMKETQFDLIVSDLDMPEMDGWEFLKKVRRGMEQQDIPAMALTALDSDTARKKAEACGFDAYEIKFDKGRFLTTVAELLEIDA